MQAKTKRNKRTLSLAKKQEVTGYLFISPFILGFLMLFMLPIFQSIRYSFSDLKMGVGGFVLEPIKWAHYEQALLIDPEFVRTLVESIGKMFLKVPIILIFSFFAATLLNQKFKGRGVARVIFFLPVILVSGVIVGVERNNLLLESMQNEAQNNSMVMMSSIMANFLLRLNMNEKFTLYIMTAVNGISDIVVGSGVQILVFLAGLQSIPSSIYEAASIEGATAWENFWKITFPMIGSLILVNTVYTVVDSFTSQQNDVMNMIKKVISQEINYGLASAMSWIYFIVIAVIVVILIGISSKKVFYYE